MPLWGRMLNRGGSQHYDRGIKLFDQGQHREAIEAFQAALAEPRPSALVERLARFYLAESHSALALAELNRSKDAEIGEDTLENLKAAIALTPHYPDLHFHLGMAYARCKQWENAIAAFDTALRINPAFARAHLQRGIVLYKSGQHEEGLLSVEKAVGLSTKFRGDLLDEARQAHRTRDAKTVIAVLERMAIEEENEALYHARIALDLFRQGMLDKAAEEYRQALVHAPNYADLRNQLGVTLYAARRDEEAVAEFARAVAINPRYVEARLNQGLALQRLGRTSEAATEFKMVLQIDPGNQVALEGLEAVEGRV